MVGVGRGCRLFRVPVMGVILGQQHIQRRHHKNGEQSADRHPAGQYQADGITGGGTQDESLRRNSFLRRVP